MPNVRDKVILSRAGIDYIGEIREVRTVHTGEKRYLVAIRDCRGMETGVWRGISGLKDLDGNPLRITADWEESRSGETVFS